MTSSMQTCFADPLDVLVDTQRDRCMTVIEQALDRGASAETILFELVVPGIEWLSQLATDGPDVTLAQLFVALQIAADVIERLIPRFNRTPASAVRIVLGTSEGEFHIKLIVGGVPYRLDHELYRTVGADAWAPTGREAAEVIGQLLERRAYSA